MIYKGVFSKCAEIPPTRLRDNVEDQKQPKKIVAQKINVTLYYFCYFRLRKRENYAFDYSLNSVKAEELCLKKLSSITGPKFLKFDHKIVT
jgi:hypothetical protein